MSSLRKILITTVLVGLTSMVVADINERKAAYHWTKAEHFRKVNKKEYDWNVNQARMYEARLEESRRPQQSNGNRGYQYTQPAYQAPPPQPKLPAIEEIKAGIITWDISPENSENSLGLGYYPSVKGLGWASVLKSAVEQAVDKQPSFKENLFEKWQLGSLISTFGNEGLPLPPAEIVSPTQEQFSELTLVQFKKVLTTLGLKYREVLGTDFYQEQLAQELNRKNVVIGVLNWEWGVKLDYILFTHVAGGYVQVFVPSKRGVYRVDTVDKLYPNTIRKTILIIEGIEERNPA